LLMFRNRRHGIDAILSFSPFPPTSPIFGAGAALAHDCCDGVAAALAGAGTAAGPPISDACAAHDGSRCPCCYWLAGASAGAGPGGRRSPHLGAGN
jgi:hypothetical protein